jgi:hypothetical protein
VSTGLVFLAGPLAAQYRYTDDKGVSKVTQYKLDVPKDYRDAAAWVGRTGIGKPALSEEARQTKLRDEAYRRIGAADAALVPYRAAEKAQQAEAARVNAVNQAAAKDRAQKQAIQKQAIQKQEQTERRAERRADEALSLQRESVELERQRAHAEQIRLNNDTQRLLYRGR